MRNDERMIRKTTITSIAFLFLLLGGTTAVYAEGNPHNLSASVYSAVTNMGNQLYTISGGQVVFASIEGQTINPATATLQYSMTISQNGLNTQGTGSFQLTGRTVSVSADQGGRRVNVSGQIGFGGIVPAAVLPLGCTTTCTSALPFFFLGASNVQVKIGHGSTQIIPETMQVESPYFNPFGAPIVLASADKAVVIVATYTQGTIVWKGTQLSGQVKGLVDTTLTYGMFDMTSEESENLVTGTAIDSGTISFSSMTPSSLNAKGTHTGSSTIPTTNTSDCSAFTGIPGTCAHTGFQSTGTFSMSLTLYSGGDRQYGPNDGSYVSSPSISGSYSGTWSNPALGFSSTISATVMQPSD
jgi:hypothetical protein